MKIWAVLVAAGKGTRFNSSTADLEKPYFSIASKPILAHALEGISKIPEIQGIVVVVSPGKEKFCQEQIIQPNKIDKVHQIVAGGQERSDSVQNGLNTLNKDVEWVLIHDGARPFVPIEQMPTLFKTAYGCGAAIFGVGLKPTIKEVDGQGFVIRTLERSRLREIQTPQVFRADLLREAYQSFNPKESKRATDDAYLVERVGGEVQVVDGDERNIKITTRFDLQVAETILCNSKGV
jgi:2-C-methyl-D-erythritol 4-phosphate cytidylyltransferase